MDVTFVDVLKDLFYFLNHIHEYAEDYEMDLADLLSLVLTNAGLPWEALLVIEN